MKKLGYVAVLIICLAAGLGIGKLRQRKHGGASAGGGDGVEIGAPKNPGVPSVGDLTANAGDAAAAATPADAGAGAGAVAAAATATETPAAPEATPTQVAESDSTTGRSFGGGSNPDPVKSSPASSGGHKRSRGGTEAVESGSGDSGSSFGGGSSSSGSSSSGSVEEGGSVGTESFGDAPTPKPPKASKSSKTKVAAAAPPPPAPSTDTFNGGSTGSGSSGGGDGIDALPVIDETPTPPPAARTASAAPATQTQVAMISNTPGDLTFPGGGSGAALKRISQRQNGDKTVVHIERSGGAKFRVFKIRNPNRVWVDFEETEVPGGDPHPVSGSNHVKEISARYIKNSGGGIPIARVQITLTDDKIPNVECNDAGGGVDCTIGGAAEKF